uniref:lymphocyte antigen 86 n=1 Tax=Jaculus jaculus TaxID=51337 RepID=UPI001E1B18A8|nr:lymphocyte antigen 86 [Jaculus jaculus]
MLRQEGTPNTRRSTPAERKPSPPSRAQRAKEGPRRRLPRTKHPIRAHLNLRLGPDWLRRLSEAGRPQGAKRGGSGELLLTRFLEPSWMGLAQKWLLLLPGKEVSFRPVPGSAHLTCSFRCPQPCRTVFRCHCFLPCPSHGGSRNVRSETSPGTAPGCTGALGDLSVGLAVLPGHPQVLTMNSATAALLAWALISVSSRGHGGGEAWPPHTACSAGGLEVLYQSCDPLQDFGLSIDQCSKHLQSNLNIRFGVILKEDIRELFLDIALVMKGSYVLNFSYPICEEDLPKFSFCGRRKGGAGDKEQDGYVLTRRAGSVLSPCLLPTSIIGLDHPKAVTEAYEQLFYAGPVANLGLDIPEGKYQVLLKLYNENRATVACANATVTCS